MLSNKITLENIEKVDIVETLWNLSERDQVIDKVNELIKSSKKDLYLQIWTEDLSEEIIKSLTEAEKHLEKSVVILFSQENLYELLFSRFYTHGFEQYKLNGFINWWINLVSNSKKVVYDTLPNNPIVVI